MEAVKKYSEKIQFILSKSGIPPHFASIGFSDLIEVHPTLINLCKSFSFDFSYRKKKGLYLYSPIPGNAKTSLAVATLRQAILNGLIKSKATFVSFPDIMAFFRQKYLYGKEFDLEDDYESVIERSDLIVLDDVGKQFADKSLTDYYFFLTNHLYEYDKPTIWTSNFSLEELRNRFDTGQVVLDSVFSRIESMCEVIKLTNRDYRL